MNLNRRNRTGVWRASPFWRCVPLWLLLPASGWASPPLETFPIPAYSFDRESPGSDVVGADSILGVDDTTPVAIIPGTGLGLGRLNDDLDAISTANAGIVSTLPFVLLFSVDRTGPGGALPDGDLVAEGVPFNVADQSARGQAAGDLYMSTTLFNTNGIILAPGGRSLANNTLVINNFDEGGRDFQANPPTSARDQAYGAPQDNVDAVTGLSTNGASTNGSGGTGRQLHNVPPLYYSAGEGSFSLDCCLPGSSPADIFMDIDPYVSGDGSESLYAAAADLGLDPQYDDIDGLIVFDLNTNGVFDPPDRVFLTLARYSLTLQLLQASPADVFLVVAGQPPPTGPPIVFAPAADLGLSVEDNIDALDIFLCDTTAVDCARRFGIRAVRGDWDNDGDVDLPDFGGFALCISGAWQDPGFAVPSELCRFVFDDDHDTDVDLDDYQVFQAGFTGPL